MSTKYELKCWLILNQFALLWQFLSEWSNFHNPVLRDRVVLNHINISATYSGPTLDLLKSLKLVMMMITRVLIITANTTRGSSSSLSCSPHSPRLCFNYKSMRISCQTALDGSQIVKYRWPVASEILSTRSLNPKNSHGQSSSLSPI